MYKAVDRLISTRSTEGNFIYFWWGAFQSTNATASYKTGSMNALPASYGHKIQDIEYIIHLQKISEEIKA